MIVRLSVSLALAGLLTGVGANAEERVHTLAKGETLSDVALAYWGKGSLADLLRTHNRLPRSAVRAGTRLRVPVPTERAANSGDTWESLARETLGDPGLAPMLAALNEGRGTKAPAPGTRVRVPALPLHRLKRGETLAAVARRFLVRTEYWSQIARLNRVENPHALKEGTPLRVPVASLGPAARADGRAPAPNVRPASVTPPVRPAKATPPPAGRANPSTVGLRGAIEAYLDGRYEEARSALLTLKPTVLSGGNREEQIELLEHLTFLHVAFDESDEACASYRELRSLDPDHRWDPIMVSPKVSRTTSLCEVR